METVMAANPINIMFKKMKKVISKNRIIFSVIVTIVIVGIGSTIVITDNIKKLEVLAAKAAASQAAAIRKEKQRLTADPITVENIYNKFNEGRVKSSTSRLIAVQNLTSSAEQFCSDMVTNNYFDYKNPTSGKEAKKFITDNANGLHYSWYVSSIYNALSNQTATQVIDDVFKEQNVNVIDPKYNSVGIAVCQPKSDVTSKYIVAMLAAIPEITAYVSGTNQNQSGSYNPNSTAYLPYVYVPLDAGGTVAPYSPPPTTTTSPPATPDPPPRTYEQAANYCRGHGVPGNSSAWDQCISAYLNQ